MSSFTKAVCLFALVLLFASAQANPSDYITVRVTPDFAMASQPGTWRVIVKTDQPITRGTQFKLRFLKGFKDLQNLLPTFAGYVKGSTSTSGGRIQINSVRSSYEEAMPFWDWNLQDKVVTFTLRDADMAAGDSIIIGIGDGNNNNARSVAHSTACQENIEVSVQLAGTPAHVLLSSSPVFNVRPLEVKEVLLFAHSVFRPGEQGKLLITTADQNLNIAEDFVGTILLSGPSSAQAVYPSSVTFTAADRGNKEIPVFFTQAGEYVFSGTVQGRPTLPVRNSNPIKVDAEMPRIFWGDVHSHGAPSRDAVGRGVYYYARYGRGLDFYCATDHADHGKAIYGLTEKEWSRQKGEVIANHKPGEFVTFLGYENSLTAPSGHYNIVFNFKNNEIGNVPNLPMRIYPTIQKLWDAIDSSGFEALTIPHHCGKIFNQGIEGTNCKDCNSHGGIYKNEKFKRQIEIYGFHGLSESYDPSHNLSYTNKSSISRLADGPHYAQDAWAIGERLGVIASTDDHFAHPGSFPHGVAAVFAEDLDRDGIFKSMQNRATYGTTGERIFLDFRINGRLMGSEIVAQPTEKPKIDFQVIGTDSIAYAELLKWDFKRGVYQNGHPVFEVVARWDRDPANVKTLKKTFTDETLSDSCMYYVRVKQTNLIKALVEFKETWAWSSPIWYSKKAVADTVVSDSLLSYNVQVVGKTVAHNWTVLNPVAVTSFRIQSKNSSGQWETFKTYASESGKTVYNWTDVSPKNGLSEYRIILLPSNSKSDTSVVKSASIELDKILSFDATLAGNQSQLTWQIKNELYSDHYDVLLERGAVDSLIEVVNAVINPAELNTTRSVNYTLPAPGKYVFKVKQYLSTGATFTSDTASVEWISTSIKNNFSVDEVFTLRSNLFNAGNVVLDIMMQRNNAQVELQVIDISGRLISTLNLANKAGEWTSLSLPKIATGTYRVNVKTQDGIYSRPFIVQ